MAGDIVSPVRTMRGNKAKMTPNITELLKNIVMPRGFTAMKAQSGVILDILPDIGRFHLVAVRREIALDVASYKSPQPEKAARE